MGRRLAVDLDETIMHLLRHFLEDYNKAHGTAFKEQDFHCYDWYKILGISNEQVYDRYFSWTARKVAEHTGESFYREFVDDAIESLSELHRDHDLYMITDRSARIHQETSLICSIVRSALDESRIFPQQRVLLTEEHGVDKAELCVRYGIPAIVDDSARVAQGCARKGVRVYLMKRPWNSALVQQVGKNDPFIIPVDGWRDVVDSIRGRTVYR